MAKTVVGLFSHISEAQVAVHRMVEDGLPRGNVSLVAHASDGGATAVAAADTGTLPPENPDYATVEPDLTNGVVTGAESGAIVGGVAGLFMGLMTFMIPGVGPVIVAGTLGSALAGAGTGAIAGGLLGGLVSSGIPEHHARHYEEGIRKGGALVVVHTEDDESQDVARALYEGGAIDIEGNTEDGRSMDGRLLSSDPQVATDRQSGAVSQDDNGIAESSYGLPTAQPAEGTTSSTSDRSYTAPPTILGAENTTVAPTREGSQNAAETNPSIAASIEGASANLNVGHAVEASQPAGPTVSGASIDNPLTAPDILEDTNAGTTPPQPRKRGARVYDSRTTPDGNWRSSTDEIFDQDTAQTLEHAA